MSTTYAQKQAPTQKKDAPTAASILDTSSQSESLQRKADMANNAAQRAEAPRPNNTGMPDNLKSGIESLSGFSMDDVRVHYNSSKPATVQALAYTQGTDIHVAPGQEKHLPHEAWHVAQQMAGRVSPTTNINGMPVNDNAGLEHEADVMGEKAVGQKKTIDNPITNLLLKNSRIIQRVNDVKCHAKISYKSMSNSNSGDVEADGLNNNLNQGTIDNYFQNTLKIKKINKIGSGADPGCCAEPHAVYNAARQLAPGNYKIKKIYVSDAESVRAPNTVHYNGNDFSTETFKHKLKRMSKHQQKISFHQLGGPDKTKISKKVTKEHKHIVPRCSTCNQWVPHNTVVKEFMPKDVITI
ncbi:MAG: DUF4157 domain-containing protein [Fibrobacter sp.]|nr:DUF4157 domain-containing protein [Fibrobacter sp.]